MATYRVGPEGATVFTSDGKPLRKLAPGQVVVAGLIEMRGSLAAQHAENERRRVAGYADKRLRPATDTRPDRLEDRGAG